MKNEKTGSRIAKIASRMLRILDGIPAEKPTWITDETGEIRTVCLIRDLRSLAASALTQTSDRPKINKVKR